jgi:glycosyltransferase involved in cell wall biosynthesis
MIKVMKNRDCNKLAVPKVGIVFHPSLIIRGGAQQVLLHIIETLQECGYKIILLTWNKTLPEKVLLNRLFSKGLLEIIPIQEAHLLKRLLKTAFSIRYISKKYMASLLVLSISGSMKSEYAILTSLATNIPILCRFATPPKFFRGAKSIFLYFLVRLLPFMIFSRKQKIILAGPSRQMAPALKHILPRLQFVELPPALDESFFNLPVCKKDPKAICAVGRIYSEKRFELAIQAARLLSESEVNFNMVIIGDVEDQAYLSRLNQMIRRYSLTDKITILTNGDPKKIKNIYCRSTIFWNFSKGFGGIVNYEALAAGCLPIVTPNLGESVGPYGFICKTPQEFASITKTLLENQHLVRQRLQGVEEWVRSNYSLEVFKSRFLLILDSLSVLH